MAASGQILRLEELSSNAALHAGASVRVLGKLTGFDAAASEATLEDAGWPLKVDTSLLGQPALRIGGLFSFIGETETRHDGLRLRARVVRCVDGIDLGLFDRALQLRRQFLQEEEPA